MATRPGRGRLARTEQPLAGSQGDVDESDEDRDFDEGSDDAGEGLAGGDAEGGDGHGDGQFEVVAGSGERQGCRRSRNSPGLRWFRSRNSVSGDTSGRQEVRLGDVAVA